MFRCWLQSFRNIRALKEIFSFRPELLSFCANLKEEKIKQFESLMVLSFTHKKIFKEIISILSLAWVCDIVEVKWSISYENTFFFRSYFVTNLFICLKVKIIVGKKKKANQRLEHSGEFIYQIDLYFHFMIHVLPFFFFCCLFDREFLEKNKNQREWI